MSEFVLSHEARQRRLDRDRRDHVRPTATIKHEFGNCAMEYGYCGECYADLFRELSDWCAQQPDPEPGEDALAYWRRIDGPFYDAWHDVASRRTSAAAKARGEL